MKCIGLCKNKLCNKTIPDNKIYCNIHNKPKRNNLLSNKKSNVKYEIIKLLSYSLSHDLLDVELLDISKQKNILTNNFTVCYICNNPPVQSSIDHIIPIMNQQHSEYGRDIDANKILCCKKCNTLKQNYGLEYIISRIKYYTNDLDLQQQKISAIKTIFTYKSKLILPKNIDFIYNNLFDIINLNFKLLEIPFKNSIGIRGIRKKTNSLKYKLLYLFNILNNNNKVKID